MSNDAVTRIVKNLKAESTTQQGCKKARTQFAIDCKNWMIELSVEAGGNWMNRFLIRCLFPKFVINMVVLATTLKHKDHEIHSKYDIRKSHFKGGFTVFKITRKGTNHTFELDVLTDFLAKASK